MDEDDNENNYEVNMEKIMARFTNFNSISSSSNQDDEDEEDNKQEEEETKKSNQDEEMFKDLPLNSEDLKVGTEPLDSQYTDNNYWKTPLYQENELDLLLEQEGLQ